MKVLDLLPWSGLDMKVLDLLPWYGLDMKALNLLPWYGLDMKVLDLLPWYGLDMKVLDPHPLVTVTTLSPQCPLICPLICRLDSLASGGFFPGPPPEPPSPGPPPLDTCMGDLFSVAWMENAESVDLTVETLQVWVDGTVFCNLSFCGILCTSSY